MSGPRRRTPAVSRPFPRGSAPSSGLASPLPGTGTLRSSIGARALEGRPLGEPPNVLQRLASLWWDEMHTTSPNQARSHHNVRRAEAMAKDVCFSHQGSVKDQEGSRKARSVLLRDGCDPFVFGLEGCVVEDGGRRHVDGRHGVVHPLVVATAVGGSKKRRELGLGEAVRKIRADRGGLEERELAVHKRRNCAVGVDREVFRSLLV